MGQLLLWLAGVSSSVRLEWWVFGIPMKVVVYLSMIDGSNLGSTYFGVVSLPSATPASLGWSRSEEDDSLMTGSVSRSTCKSASLIPPTTSRQMDRLATEILLEIFDLVVHSGDDLYSGFPERLPRGQDDKKPALYSSGTTSTPKWCPELPPTKRIRPPRFTSVTYVSSGEKSRSHSRRFGPLSTSRMGGRDVSSCSSVGWRSPGTSC